MDEVKAKQVVLKIKTMALSDLLAVFRASLTIRQLVRWHRSETRLGH